MKPVLAAVALAAAALAVGVAAQSPHAPRPRLVSPPVSPPLLAISFTRYGAKVLEVDPGTLAPKPGPRLEVGFYTAGWSFSADRSRLALGDAQGRLLVVDPRNLRRSVSFDPGGPGGMVASAWDGDRLLTLSRGPTGVVARTVDWPRRRVVAASRVGGRAQAVAHAGTRLVVLLAPSRGFGAARVAVIGSNSRVRIVSLPRIRVGSAELDPAKGPLQVLRHSDGGLAAANGHAFVVAAGAPVADVELSSLRVSYHDLGRRSSLAARLAGWLQPAAQAKGAPDGPRRSALWLGDGVFAIAGEDDHGTVDRRGRPRLQVTPAGVTVVDTRSWTATTVAPHAARAAVGDDALLVYAVAWDGARRRETGVGLRVLAADGRERFHLFGSEPIADVQVIGRHAVVARSRFRSAVVDLTTGRVVSRNRGWPLRFLVGEPLPG